MAADRVEIGDVAVDGEPFGRVDQVGAAVAALVVIDDPAVSGERLEVEPDRFERVAGAAMDDDESLRARRPRCGRKGGCRRPR